MRFTHLALYGTPRTVPTSRCTTGRLPIRPGTNDFRRRVGIHDRVQTARPATNTEKVSGTIFHRSPATTPTESLPQRGQRRLHDLQRCRPARPPSTKTLGSISVNTARGSRTDSTPYVGYNYDAGNGYRLASISTPTSIAQVSYNYGETGTPDNSLNRLSTITDNSAGQTLAAYSYLGLNTVATEDFQQPKIKLDYSGGNDAYTALDRFGRVRDQIWSDYGNDTTADGYSYTYDQAGNVRAARNNLDNA